MLNVSTVKLTKLLLTLPMLLAIAACSDDDNPLPAPVESETPATPTPPAPVNRSYEVTVTNLTQAQPFSPTAVALHAEGQFWQIGAPASEALEYLAEGGDNSFILQSDTVVSGSSGQGPIPPGGSETITVSITDNQQPRLSVITMLVNTNDAFTGLNAQNLAELDVGERMMRVARAYDSGTEANSELAGTIPGPIDDGVGFDANRDDVDFVALHPGIVSAQDGLVDSVLSYVHAFDNPVARITIVRTE